uniref:Novel STAND NTPase 3 domain-containing protein n=1 Tax=Magallana gigas TaxID=29159 RepID=A0A8W8IGG9_MAGGI
MYTSDIKKKLDGYKFPVYSTEFCPRNQTEWNERSSAINCTKDNGYLCFPNEKFTQLLEFCHRARFIWIQEGYCLYLRTDDSTIYSYSCSSFQSGSECHNSSFPSYDLFKYPSCTSIGNGCFLAEPSCKGIDTTTQPPETTKTIQVAIASMNANKTLIKKEFAIKDEVTMIRILYGVLISISVFCIACIIYRGGIQLRKRRDDEEQPLIRTDICDNAELVVQESPVDRAIFMQWQDDNRQFVSTRACKEVEKLIKSQNLVVVTGNSGSGKSAIIQHIALCFRSQGWKVKPVYNVKEIADTYSSVDGSQSRLLFVFNDPIGNESFDEIAYNSWKEHEERLKAFLKNSKMLLSSRKYILLDDRVKGMLNDKSCSIDLSDDKHKLNNEEKKNILMSYSSNSGLLKDDINGILMTEEYFPLLCKLYFSDKNNQTIGPRFFKEPFNVCQEQIRNFRNDSKKECKEKYCALVLLVLCNNQLCVEDIHEKDCLKEKFKLALKLCGIQKSTAPHTIGDALKTLEGFYVKKIDDTYHFYHDFVMEVTTYVFGTDYPKETIQYADIGFLRRRVTLKSSNDNRTEIDRITIYLNDKYVSDLADRLFNDVFGDRLLDVVLNPCVRNEKMFQNIV